MLSAIGRRGGWPSWASVLVHSICTGESDPCDRTGTSIGLAACAATLSLLSPISSAANCRLRLVVTICRRRPCHGPKALFPRVKSQSGEASLGVSRRGPRARSFLVSFLPAPNSHRIDHPYYLYTALYKSSAIHVLHASNGRGLTTAG